MEIRDLDKVLVDTSAWIEFFRKKEPYYSIILELIDDDRVCCAGIILAELLQGAKSAHELKVLKEFLHVFDFLHETAALWEGAGELSYALSRKGKSVGLSDCYISVVAVSNNIKLLTLDKHFETIKSEVKLSFHGINRRT